MKNGMVLDGVLAQDQSQFQSLWSLREMLPEANGKAGSVYKYDVSVPVAKMYGLVETMRNRLRKAGLLDGDGKPEGPIRAVTGYGHMGDGKHSLNARADRRKAICTSTSSPTNGLMRLKRSSSRSSTRQSVSHSTCALRFPAEGILAENDGSISAEHGLGTSKSA